MKGPWPKRPGYKATAKTFTYVLPASIIGVAGSAPVRVSQTMDNYDFELYNIILALQNNASYTAGEEGSAQITFVAVAPGASAITLTTNATGAPNSPLSITVVGSAITVQLATDAAGNPLGTSVNSGNLVGALWNATPAAVALATITVQVGLLQWPGFGPVSLGPANEGSPLTAPVSSLWLYDSNKVQISNAPVLDVFMDGGEQAIFTIPSGSVYGNGCVQPPLFYPKETVINIDVYSQITDPTKLPTGLLIHLVGRKYYPC